MPEAPLLDLGPESGLPSPKVKGRKRDGATSWSSFLPAFSENFAFEALKELKRSSAGLVYDPFVGSGTSMVAASRLGLPSIGNDLDPVSAILTRAKLCRKADRKAVRHYLRPTTAKKHSKRYTVQAEERFRPCDLIFASSVFSRLEVSLGSSGQALFQMLLQDVAGRWDSEVIAIASLMLSAKQYGRFARGSNPVWFRTSLQAHSESKSLAQLSSIQLADRMLTDLGSNELTAASALVMNENAIDGGPPENSVDFILTSPPYLNRLDYVVHHGPELALLSGLMDVEVNELRSAMTGTTKMSKKHPATPDLGKLCHKTLKLIKNHNSYASERYYYPFFVNYFHDMAGFFSNLRRQTKRGGSGFMVVQNSYYKDIPIPIELIFSEMANIAGFSVKSYIMHDVRTHLGQLSPTQNRYAPKKSLKEWVLKLKF